MVKKKNGLYRCQPKNRDTRVPQNGWKTLLKWMIWGAHPYFWVDTHIEYDCWLLLGWRISLMNSSSPGNEGLHCWTHTNNNTSGTGLCENHLVMYQEKPEKVVGHFMKQRLQYNYRCLPNGAPLLNCYYERSTQRLGMRIIYMFHHSLGISMCTSLIVAFMIFPVSQSEPREENLGWSDSYGWRKRPTPPPKGWC